MRGLSKLNKNVYKFKKYRIKMTYGFTGILNVNQQIFGMNKFIYNISI